MNGSSNPSTYTVCFSGTACTRDEGEETRLSSNKHIYADESGYIPVRIHRDISGDLTATTHSVIVRGVGENDWGQWRSQSSPLLLNGPLVIPDALRKEAGKYSDGNQISTAAQTSGWSAPALALHAANLAASSNAGQFNFIGHSRGAVECIMAAWFLYAYGPKDIPVNVFAIDPVPGPGDWYGILTQLPPNVHRYVGVYAWDHLDPGFMALVPRPNGRMTGTSGSVALGDSWMTLADNYQLDDPLTSNDLPQPDGYELYVCRGRHGTVAGNSTSDGQYDPAKVSSHVAPVPKLVYKMARAYLDHWGTTFQSGCAVTESTTALRRQIHTDHAEFDAMGGGATRTSKLPNRPYVRQVSSTSGRAFWKYHYLEDVVGDPPYPLSYPVTVERSNAGWVKWQFL